MAIPVRKSGAACGAEIMFDLSQPIDEATFGKIELLFHDNIMVVFRDQHLTEEQHIAFSRRFGELDWAPVQETGRRFVEGYPELYVVSNVIENGVPSANLLPTVWSPHHHGLSSSRPRLSRDWPGLFRCNRLCRW